MQDVSASVDNFHPVSDIRMLPIVDLNPNDMSCVLSVLKFVEKQAARLNMETACVTFDQPLYIKAVEIAHAADLNVVCRLGGFHLLMNFMGAIGAIMNGSGLSAAWETCYGPVTITHMTTGKAYAKALRGHFLVESSLMILLMENMFGSYGEQSDASVSQLHEIDISSLRDLYKDASQWAFDCTDATNPLPVCLQHLGDRLSDHKQQLVNDDRTARLWVQYLDYVRIVKQFLRAERTSDWSLHLLSVSQMLNLLSAAGHNNYAKCARVYLQLMADLPVTHPWLHQQLSCGRHAVRRSDRHWAAISTDLAIEQVMMRSVKNRGGLTHGRGFTESVRLTWVQMMHFCATIHAALTSLTNLAHSANDNQHVELGQARIARDSKDLSRMIDWFRANNPFCCTDSGLHSLSTGLVAGDDDGINCDTAETVGACIHSKMDNLAFSDVILKKAKTLRAINGKFSVAGTKRLPVDSTVLFSRLLVVLQRQPDISCLFKYELTAVPTAFFKGESLRKTDKSQLAKVLTTNVQSSNIVSVSRAVVVDGGWLVHKVKWQPGGTYADIAAQYVSFVAKHFGSSALVVFDGYESGPTTKDHEHGRRAELSSPDVLLSGEKPAYRNQSAFLCNGRNKAKFVAFLTAAFKDKGYAVQQSVDDADTVIVSAALELAGNTEVTVVANDTDVLVLLVYHFTPPLNNVYLHSEVSTRNSNRTTLWSIRDIRSAIGENAARQLLVIHAISGCDSTSCLYGQGKASVWRKITSNDSTLPLTDVIESLHVSHESVVEAGLKLLTLLYGGKLTDSLNQLRYARYIDITASAMTPLRPERLPPTENAAKYHIFRTHIQVVQWKSLMNTAIDATEWGWKITDGQYIPIATDLEAAPDYMLSVIRCKCKMETKHPCSSQHCTCVKYGLACVAACKHCNGHDCENPSVAAVVLDETDSEEIVQEQGETDDLYEEMSDESLELVVPWLVEEVV